MAGHARPSGGHVDQRDARCLCRLGPDSRIAPRREYEPRTGVLDVISSDHAPYNFRGPSSKSAGGTDVPFTRIPNGVPGVETRLPIVFSEGVSKGRIDLQTFVALTAANAAQLFGIFPQKGTIAVGSAADVAIRSEERRVGAEGVGQCRTRWSPAH